MIELKDIKKTFKTSKGIKVEALIDINIDFEDKGLVFILGKSGSGKSTLMNILGGLDKADSGSLIIKGKNLNQFSQANFDSYRNTMIGFVFQNFYLIENFSVKQNIELACQLQGKKETDISNILRKVDLHGYETRMPNELSGGQMQRVAIARALIKDPKIILADEPTGNLDSETGSQIFELLKDLSKDKLVIVVTHDRETALKYGDRIIELSDGKVISDTVEDVIKKNNDEGLKLLKAKLPKSVAVKIAIGNFKSKFWRMSLTVFLASLAIMFFSVALLITSTNDFNLRIENITKAGFNYAIVNKERGFTFEEAKTFITEHPQYKINLVYDNDGSGGYQFYEEWPDVATYYSRSPKGFVEITTNNKDYYSALLSEGSRLPENPQEIVITNYYAESFVEFGYKEYNGQTKINVASIEDMIGKTLNFDGSNLKVVGIINYDTTNYQMLKRDSDEFANRYNQFYKYTRLSEEKQNNLKYNMRDVLVTSGYFQTIPGYNRTDAGLYYLQVMLEPDQTSIENTYQYFNEIGYTIFTPLDETLTRVFEMRAQLSTVFIVLSIVLAIFSILFIYNFINLSIRNNIKEIGILRAIGARGRDVFSIYIFESILMASIIGVLSIVFSILGKILTNSFIFNLYPYYVLGQEFSVTMVTYTWQIPIIIIVICLISTFIATFIPTLKVSKMKPIDAIKSN